MYTSTFSKDAYDTGAVEVLALQLGLEVTTHEDCVSVWFDSIEQRDRFNNTVAQPWEA